jgi:DNA-binding MarR family transcriptional regulator
MRTRLKKVTPEALPEAPFAYPGLDRLIHEHARLSVLTCLVSHSRHGLSFNELKRLCGLTDGNLSRHLQVLEDAGLITVWKGTERNRSVTRCRVAAAGRKRYVEYLAVLEHLVVDAAAAVKSDKTPQPVGRSTLPAPGPANCDAPPD